MTDHVTQMYLSKILLYTVSDLSLKFGNICEELLKIKTKFQCVVCVTCTQSDYSSYMSHLPRVQMENDHLLSSSASDAILFFAA
jgi:hypothetical protein